MRAVAGFPKDAGHYFLKRAQIVVPDSLRQLIWPTLDDWRQRYRLHAESGYSLSYNDEGVDEPSMAADGFLTMMIELRDVLLQDAALLIQMHSHSSLFHHRVFKHPAWASFALAVQTAESRMEEPVDIQLQKIVPVVAERTMQESVIGNIQLLGNTLGGGLEKVTGLLKDLINGRVRFTGCFGTTDQTTDQTVSTSFALSQSASESSGGNLSGTDSTSHLVPVRSPPLAVSSNAPVYILNSEVYTVTDLWREWHSGIGGGPSIVSLNEKHGKAWRAGYNGAQAMWYSRRLFLINEIKRRAGDSIHEQAEVVRMEGLRVDNGWSIQKLVDHLKGQTTSRSRKRKQQ